MPEVTIEHQIAIRMGGRCEWKVNKQHLVDVHGEQFIKLVSSSGHGWTKLVCEGQIQGGVPKNASLCRCPGLRQLYELRNQRQCEELSSSSKATGPMLFDNQPEQGLSSTRKPKRTMQQVREARETLDTLIVDIPGVGDVEPLAVRMLRPVHSRDDLCVPLDSKVLQHLICFIRNAGISRDDLQSKRSYKSAGYDAPPGIWASSKGFVVKLPQADEESAPARKYKRVSTIGAALAELSNADDDLQDLQPIQDASDGLEQGDSASGEEDSEQELHHADTAVDEAAEQHQSSEEGSEAEQPLDEGSKQDQPLGGQ